MISRHSNLISLKDLAANGFNYWEERFIGHWAGIEVGINGHLNDDYSRYSEDDKFLQNDILRSNALNINFFQFSQGIQQTRHYIGLVTGLGISMKSYRLDNNTSIELDSLGKITLQNLYSYDNQKSKLSSVYLTIPLLIEFQVLVHHHSNRFYCSMGIETAKRLSTHTKIKYRQDGKKEKLKSPGDYAIHDYKFAAMIRMGYRWVNLFATYDLVPMFKENRGPEMHPFTVGITLLSF